MDAEVQSAVMRKLSDCIYYTLALVMMDTRVENCPPLGAVSSSPCASPVELDADYFLAFFSLVVSVTFNPNPFESRYTLFELLSRICAIAFAFSNSLKLT